MLKEIANSIHKCGVSEVPPLRRNFLTNRTVTCNDGSPAGYYLRRSYGSFKWIIFLEDGWYCFDKHSCDTRWVTMKPYMSSKHWPEVKKGSGITSWDPEENPYYYHANMVYIPYCSSDTWTGTYKANNKEDFSFMGSLIIEEVLKDLLTHGLANGNKLILAGSSAGGTGVLLNVDRVADNMAEWVPGIEVRGVSDSGWFLDNKQYKPAPCMNAHSCGPVDGIKRGVNLWNGRLPRRCEDRYADSEKWRCYFGYRLYPTLKTPVYIVQFMFDVAQLTADNVGPPVHKDQWRYIHQLGQDIKESLRNVSAVFAPACMSHIMLMKRNWNQVRVGRVSLPQSIYCWESSSSRRKGYRCRGGNGRRRHRHKQTTTTSHPSVSRTPPNESSSDNPLSDAPKRKKKRKRNKKRRRNRRKRKRKNKGKRERRSLQPWLDNIPNEVCRRRLVDNCQWPQCNSACPKLVNPLTGVEVDVVDLLVQLGIEPATFANTLGIDINRLHTMSHDKLIRRLAQ
ncbi:palmitoleoylnotum1-like,protein carboxylesterase NOTUM [Argonauta hians]